MTAEHFILHEHALFKHSEKRGRNALVQTTEHRQENSIMLRILSNTSSIKGKIKVAMSIISLEIRLKITIVST